MIFSLCLFSVLGLGIVEKFLISEKVLTILKVCFRVTKPELSDHVIVPDAVEADTCGKFIKLTRLGSPKTTSK